MTSLNIINASLTALSILVLLPIATFCVECLAAAFLRGRRQSPDTDAAEQARAVVLIPAHNEQLVIEQTLGTMLAPHWRTSVNRVLVVADNCDDRTADLAQDAGAEVVVRIDPDHRGKGYALDAGVQAMRANPPDVVVVIDADCLASPQTINTLASIAFSTQRPVQALNLTDRNPATGPIQAVSLLGNRFTNMIRPLGLRALGVPCRLMGTGMAIPWRLADNVQLAGGSLVEDMQLGIDLALQGHLTVFCPEARVTSGLPPADRAFVSQRTRWEHGHLRTAITQVPPLLAAAWSRQSWPLLGIALDLSIPPLTLLVALWLGAAILAAVAAGLGASWLPVALLAAGGVAMAVALGVGWAVFCRQQVPLGAFAAVPLYMLRKLPIYAGLIFRRQHAWVRTERPSVEKS